MWEISQIILRAMVLVGLAFGTVAFANWQSGAANAESAAKRALQRRFKQFLSLLTLLFVIEVVIFLLRRTPDDTILSPLRMFGGLHWAGLLTTLWTLGPLAWGWRAYRENFTAPLHALENQLKAFQAKPETAFIETQANSFQRDWRRLDERSPARLRARLAPLRTTFLALTQNPPVEVCLQRAIEFIKQGKQAEALVWAKRWNPARVEYFLFCLEMKAWSECNAGLANLESGALREEALQLLADLPETEELRNLGRERLRDNRVMLRRRAILEYKNGHHEVAQRLLENDWEAANWLRADLAEARSPATMNPSAAPTQTTP